MQTRRRGSEMHSFDYTIIPFYHTCIPSYYMITPFYYIILHLIIPFYFTIPPFYYTIKNQSPNRQKSEAVYWCQHRVTSLPVEKEGNSLTGISKSFPFSVGRMRTQVTKQTPNNTTHETTSDNLKQLTELIPPQDDPC